MGKKRSEIIAAKRRKARDERKEAERREREVTDGTGTAEIVHTSDKKLTCEVCDKKFANKKILKKHYRYHKSDKPFACDDCDKKFLYKYALNYHRIRHAGVKPTCPDCNKEFLSQGTLVRHRKALHSYEKPKPFACPECDKKFYTKLHMTEHYISHTGDGVKPTCPDCNKEFLSQGTLVRHRIALHSGERPRPYACRECDKKFVSEASLDRHRIALHSGERPRPFASFTCADCNKKFMSKGSLVRHRNALHSGERPRPYACPECDKKFYEKVHMTDHYKSHTGERPYVCEKCGNSYARNSGFLYHSCSQTRKKPFTYTVPNGKGLFVCQICGKTLTTGASLRSHYRLHTDKFACSACGKRFCTGTALKEHSYTHTGERPFVCEICGEDFARKLQFKTHLLLHSNTNVFACPDCDMKFGCRSDLTVHRRIHGKKISCDVCGKTFAEKRYLFAHIRIHTGEKPYACSYCDKRFACKSNLLVHRRKHTGEKRTPRKPRIEILNSRFNESPSIDCHVTKSSISDDGVIDSGLSYESQTIRESIGIDTGQVADDSSGEKSFDCSLCDEKFALESDLKAHFHASYIDTGEKPFVCEICGEDFARKTLLENHMLLHKGLSKYLLACSDCDMKFGCRSDLTVHRRIHGNKFSCDICGKTFAEKYYLSAHMKRIHTGEKQNPCKPHIEIFNPRLIELPSIERHVTKSSISDIDVIDSGISYESQTMRESTGINTGQLADDSSGEKSFSCSQCDEKVACESDLNVHFRFHASEKPTVSEPCTETLSSDRPPSEQGIRGRERRDSTDSDSTVEYLEMEGLVPEINNSGIEIKSEIVADELKDVVSSTDQPVEAHPVEAGMNVLGEGNVSSDLDRCPSPVHSECSSNAACSLGSPEHSEIDTSEKLNATTGCEMKFPDMSMLFEEIVHVINQKIFPCPACGMKFPKRGLMKAHKTSAHPGYKPFACEVCEKRFARKSEFSRHTKTCRKPHACRICDMRFSTKQSLKTHRYIHYIENAYTCNVCMKQFYSKKQLESHHKSQHRQIPFATVFVPRKPRRNKSRSNLTEIKERKSSELGIGGDMLSANERGRDGPADEITGEPGKNSSADIDVNSDPTNLAAEFNEMKRSKSEIDGDNLSVDEYKKEYPDSGKEMTVDMLSDLSVGTSLGEAHIDMNPIPINCGAYSLVHTASQVTQIQPSHSNEVSCTMPFENFRFIKILKYPRREKTHECLHCDKKFASRTQVIVHQRIHTGEKPYSCSVCEKHFRSKNNLNTHKRIHSDLKPYSCSDCGMEFRNRDKFSNHRKMKCAGDKPFPCLVCNKRFVCKSQLVNHFRNHTDEKPFVCHECDMKFTQAALLKQHIKQNHTGERPFVCTICDKKFSQKGHFNAHCKIHTGEKPFICELCGKNYLRKDSLEKHMRSHSNKKEKPRVRSNRSGVEPSGVAGEMSFMCEICGKNFSSINGLKSHSKIHTGEKNETLFTCADCGKKFVNKRNLIWHQKIHTGECLFSCPDCPENFSKMCHLIEHRIIHAGDKALVCLVCGKKFLLKSHLNSHMKYHTGERSLECSDCHKRFRRRGHLNVHRRIHTGEKPYACSNCDMRYTHKIGLDNHRKKHHTDAEVSLEQNINRRAFQSITSSP